jgi:hypothetical protein
MYDFCKQFTRMKPQVLNHHLIKYHTMNAHARFNYQTIINLQYLTLNRAPVPCSYMVLTLVTLLYANSPSIA